MIGRSGRFVQGKTLPGAIYWKWEPSVPFIALPAVGSSIFLYGSEGDAHDGANWGGSGVLVGIPSIANKSRVHLYAVTNDHVAIGCPVVRLVDKAGKTHVLPPDEASSWLAHPDGDDIAIRPLGAVPEREYWYVPDDLILSQADLSPKERLYQISPGDDCVMVGRYINRDLRQFDRPVVRFGNLAMLPEFIYQDKRSFDQESFLVDMRSHAGFSGSPVFVYYEEPGWRHLPPAPEEPSFDELPDPADVLANPEAYASSLEELVGAHEERMKAYKAHGEALSQRVDGRDLSGVMGKKWLLGIDWGHLPIWDDVFDDKKNKIGRMRVNSGMAGVVPGWKLTDLLEEEEIKMGRGKAEEQLAKIDEGTANLDIGEQDEFARFEGLTRKLVNTPKPKPNQTPAVEETS